MQRAQQLAAEVLVAVAVRLGEADLVGEHVQALARPSIALREDEEWAELRAETAGLPLRGYGPAELKRVALAQVDSKE